MLGLGGNLSNFQWHYNGQEYQGDAITYGHDMAGYTNDPADTIHYVSKHDNQTLWDNHPIPIATDDGQNITVKTALTKPNVPTDCTRDTVYPHGQ